MSITAYIPSLMFLRFQYKFAEHLEESVIFGKMLGQADFGARVTLLTEVGQPLWILRRAGLDPGKGWNQSHQIMEKVVRVVRQGGQDACFRMAQVKGMAGH